MYPRQTVNKDGRHDGCSEVRQKYFDHPRVFGRKRHKQKKSNYNWNTIFTKVLSVVLLCWHLFKCLFCVCFIVICMAGGLCVEQNNQFGMSIRRKKNKNYFVTPSFNPNLNIYCQFTLPSFATIAHPCYVTWPHHAWHINQIDTWLITA